MKINKLINNFYLYSKNLSIIILICLYKFFFNYSIPYFHIQKQNNFTIYKEEKFDSFNIAFKNAKSFINNNIKGKLLYNIYIQQSEKPKISAIISCHNCKNYISKAIRSIQNQNFSNTEII